MKPEIQTPSTAGSETNRLPGTTAGEPDLLRAELAEQKNLYLHLAADFENFKRRSRQEGESRAATQKEALIHDLLPVVDNLERALASGVSPSSLQFHQGVEMTLQQLLQLLRQHGIITDEIVGRPFDPHQQEAVSQGHDPAQPDNVILTVLQRGYRRGEMVFRPAKVVVNDLTHSRQGRHAR
jgi:molecular chaperone GrpE